MDNKEITVAGVVVFYNPSKKDFSNIRTYLDEVDRLYIVDNSDKALSDDAFKCFDAKVSYFPLYRNTGLGYATNYGARMAYEDGYSWMLLLDQDTVFEKNAIAILKKYASDPSKHYSLFCPNIIAVGDSNEEFYTVIPDKKQDIEINWATASGSLIKLVDYWTVGGVWADLFIEHLDVELGVKFAEKGYRILRVGSSVMRQRFGNSQPKKLLWKTVHPGFTKPIRYYYIFRNQALLKKKYGRSVTKFTGIHLYTAVVKILLFEDYRVNKIVMAIRGTIDGYKGKIGEAKF